VGISSDNWGEIWIGGGGLIGFSKARFGRGSHEAKIELLSHIEGWALLEEAEGDERKVLGSTEGEKTVSEIDYRSGRH